MLPVGHMVAACGSAWLAKRELAKRDGPGTFVGLFERIDYRLVAFGALLPDLVDKPIVWFVLRDSELGGHHVGHSVLFSITLLAVGLAVAAQGDNRVLLITFGAITHLLFDVVTHVPWSILYPFMEVDVPRNEIILGATNIAGEVAAVIALFIVLKRPGVAKRVSAYVREGSIES